MHPKIYKQDARGTYFIYGKYAIKVFPTASLYGIIHHGNVFHNMLIWKGNWMIIRNYVFNTPGTYKVTTALKPQIYRTYVSNISDVDNVIWRITNDKIAKIKMANGTYIAVDKQPCIVDLKNSINCHITDIVAILG